MGKWRSRLYKTDRARDFDHERDRQVRARQVYETVDRQPFQWVVVLVAGVGFFLDGYTLFAGNIALPMISYVYWKDDTSHDRISYINMATLASTTIGMISFGVFADKKGRRKMYGMELAVLIMSTLGAAMASTGTHNSMSVYTWFIIWRVLTGIAVGADYPLSAIMASEFAPTAQRARMLATIFFMQPLGQMASNLVAMVVITMTRRALGDADYVRAVDIMWRWIVGLGVVPGVLGIVFRLAIPETPRFVLEIEDDPVKAEFNATDLFGNSNEDDDEELISPVSKEEEAGIWMFDATTAMPPHRPAALVTSDLNTVRTYYHVDDVDNIDYTHHEHDEDDRLRNTPSALSSTTWTVATARLPTLNSEWSVTRADIYQYFFRERNIVTLLAVAFAWLLLDFSFYGIGLSSPHFLAKTWGVLNISGRSPPWEITDDPSVSIYDMFLSTSIHALVILNLGSFVGGLLLILAINRLDRVLLQRIGFLLLMILFIGMARIFLYDPPNRQGPILISLYVVAQFLFNFGPNATTFMLPAELFPTRYRATCHGLSAAMGKLGSVMIQLISAAIARSGHPHHAPLAPGEKPTPEMKSQWQEMRAQHYGYTLFGFGAAMFLGFIVSLYIPRVQERVTAARPVKIGSDGKEVKPSTTRKVFDWFADFAKDVVRKRLRSKTLEQLSLGRKGLDSASASRAARNGW